MGDLTSPTRVAGGANLKPGTRVTEETDSQEVWEPRVCDPAWVRPPFPYGPARRSQ